MRIKFTTTIDDQLVEQLKIESIKKKVGSNDIIENLLLAHFDGKPEAGNSTLSADEWKEISEIISSLSDWSWHNAQGYAAEKRAEAIRNKETKKDAEEIYKNTLDDTLKRSFNQLAPLKKYLMKLGMPT